MKDEDGLCQGKDAGGLEERVRAEEGDQWGIAENGGPDEGHEEEGAELSEPAGSWRETGRINSENWAIRFSGTKEYGEQTADEVVQDGLVGLLQNIARSSKQRLRLSCAILPRVVRRVFWYACCRGHCVGFVALVQTMMLSLQRGF